MSAPLNSQSIVSVRGVSRYFGVPALIRVLTDVNLEIRRGEVFGLVGPADAGKSTTLRILAGRLPPSEGKASVFGLSPRNRSVRARIGYLPERFSHDKSRLFVQTTRLLARLPLWPKPNETARPGGLSPGSDRRLALKRLFARAPDLLLLDEPFAGLDAAECAETKALIAALAQGGRTVVLTGRTLIHAMDICHRLAIYHAGKIEAFGSLAEILSAPDAIRFTSPVLPRETSQRLLHSLRKDLLPAAEAPSPTLRQQSPAVAEPAPAAATAEELLAPLVASPSKAVPQETPAPAISPIDHDRLDALTKTPAPVPPQGG